MITQLADETLRTTTTDRVLSSKYGFIEATVPISIKFENLNYSVREERTKSKQILDGVSGEFCSGELTAILGASGSGKTSLLNILSGYVKENVRGRILLNREERDGKFLRKLSAYIMQSDLLQPHLTVEEQMTIVAKLKLPNSPREKQLIIDEIVDVLKLKNCYTTRVEKLSGGERKRLSIALELISNPPVIFLDEPTSGLDSVTINLCVGILRELSNAGKTVICSIHQPSVSIMNQFHQVYFIAKGSCIYNGSADNILPFLSSVNLNCPITYSYSEFIIETVEINPETVQLLSAAIENGKTNCRKTGGGPDSNRNCEMINITRYRTTFWTQFVIILHRMMLQQSRNKIGLMIQLFSHILIGVIFGLAFFGIGNNAKTTMSNVMFCFMCIMFFLYNPVMNNILIFPLEIEVLRREYLNRWYGFTAYYLALSLRTLPITIILGVGLISVAYFMTDQPNEFDRFFRFTLTCILVSVTSEGLGLVIGCTFGILGGAILGPCIIAPIALVPLYGFGFGRSVSSAIKIAMRLSYMRSGIIASIYALMEDRPPLECVDIFCYYTDPKHVLRDTGILNYSFYLEILGLLSYATLFRILAYLVLKYRMKEELTGKNSDYLAQILRLKN